MQIINFHKTALFWKLVFLKLGLPTATRTIDTTALISL